MKLVSAGFLSEAMKQFQKKAYEWENKDKVAEVIEGPKN